MKDRARRLERISATLEKLRQLEEVRVANARRACEVKRQQQDELLHLLTGETFGDPLFARALTKRLNASAAELSQCHKALAEACARRDRVRIKSKLAAKSVERSARALTAMEDALELSKMIDSAVIQHGSSRSR